MDDDGKTGPAYMSRREDVKKLIKEYFIYDNPSTAMGARQYPPMDDNNDQ
jgi:hypothetical protein